MGQDTETPAKGVNLKVVEHDSTLAGMHLNVVDQENPDKVIIQVWVGRGYHNLPAKQRKKFEDGLIRNVKANFLTK